MRISRARADYSLGHCPLSEFATEHFHQRPRVKSWEKESFTQSFDIFRMVDVDAVLVRMITLLKRGCARGANL